MAGPVHGPCSNLVEAHLNEKRVLVRRLGPGIAVVGSYIALGLIANLFAWLHGPTHELQHGADLAQEAWFVGFTPYSLIHGHNPLVTNWINYPYGVNMMTNTSMFLPSILLAPITFLWGPVASLNVLLVLGLSSSAAAAYFVFLRWAKWKPAAFVGGLLYGFSPYMDGQGWGHLFLVFAALPPLLLLVFDEIVVTQRHRAVRWGVLLGILISAQLFISAEVLASEIVIGGIGILLLICFRRHEAMSHARHAITGIGTAFVTFMLICSYPLWISLFGTDHISGPAQSVGALAPYSADLVGLVVPMSNQAISPFQQVTRNFVNGDVAESGAYMGLALLIVLVLVFIRYRNLAIVRFFAAMTGVALVLTLGSRLRVDGFVTDIYLPFYLLTRLPLLDSSIAIRYSLYVFLFAGLLLSVALDRVHAEGIGRITPGKKAAIVCASVAVFALVPLVPRWPYPMTDTGVPAFFRSPEVASIPDGSVLLTYPFPRSPHDQAMLWQVENGLRYRIPGGYLITPGRGRSGTFDGVPSVTENLLEDAYKGEALPALSSQLLGQVRKNLDGWGIETIVVTPIGRDPDEAAHLFTVLLGRPPANVDGSQQWSGVQDLLEQASAEAPQERSLRAHRRL